MPNNCGPILCCMSSEEPMNSPSKTTATASRFPIRSRRRPSSPPSASAYTPRDLAGDVDGLLAALDLPAAHVVGHSLGGAIAQELALASPDRVRTLTLIGSWARNDEYTRTLFRGWKRLRTTLEPAAFLETMLLTGVGHTFLNSVGVDAMVQMFLAAPNPQTAEGFCRQVDADLAHDTLDRLGKIQPPTLVIAGDEDKIFPLHHARQLVDGIGGEWLLIPNVGHSPALEKAEAVNAALETFFTSH